MRLDRLRYLRNLELAKELNALKVKAEQNEILASTRRMEYHEAVRDKYQARHATHALEVELDQERVWKNRMYAFVTTTGKRACEQAGLLLPAG